jgi:hypothetical protein
MSVTSASAEPTRGRVRIATPATALALGVSTILLTLTIFAGLVLLSTRVLPFSSPVGVAASMLAASALCNPLRNRIQHAVDRRFNRGHCDAEALVAAFGSRLRDEIDVDTVLAELANAAGRSLQPAHVTAQIKP